MKSEIIFKSMRNFISDINKTSSNLDKLEVLRKYSDNEIIPRILYYTYNPFMQYNVTSKNLSKNKSLNRHNQMMKIDNFFNLLECLDTRAITGHSAIASVNYFIENHEEYRTEIMLVLDRNLKTRADTKLINKVFKNLIPTFSVALANSYSKVKDKVDLNKDTWFASRKLDGVRVLTIIDENGKVNFYSRSGKEFLTLQMVREDVEQLNLKSIVLDGEMCITDKNGDEDFQSVIKLIRKKDFTIANPKYKLFDMINLEDFNDKKGRISLKRRLLNLKSVISYYSNLKNTNSSLDMVEQKEINQKSFEKFFEYATEQKWEGLILRKNVGYAGKRSNDMLKVKKFHDAEYEVIDIETGTMRIFENSKEVEREVVSAVVIMHKGNKVGVGSGFSVAQRLEFLADPSKIVGKIITVQYFEESQNQNGDYSLRFPVIKAIYDKRDT